MSCNNCPHLKAVTKALEPCQLCDCGRLNGQVHIDHGKLDYAPLLPNYHTPTEGVTSLPPDVEDKLRKMVSDLFGLSPIQLLMVQFMFKQDGSPRPFAGFGEHLREVAKKINSYRGETMDRSTSRKMARAIAQRFSALGAVFKSVVNSTRTESDCRGRW